MLPEIVSDAFYIAAFAEAGAASPNALKFVQWWAEDHDATLLDGDSTEFTEDGEVYVVSGAERVVQASTELFTSVISAYRLGYLLLVEEPDQYYLPPRPAGCELILIKGAVRWGFALKHGSAIWMGYSVAGNGTDGFVWAATPAEYAAFAAFTTGVKS